MKSRRSSIIIRHIGRREFCPCLRLKRRTRKSFKRNRKRLQQRKGGLHYKELLLSEQGFAIQWTQSRELSELRKSTKFHLYN